MDIQQVLTIATISISFCSLCVAFTVAIMNNKRAAVSSSVESAASNASQKTTMEMIANDVKDIKAESRVKAEQDNKNHIEMVGRMATLEQHQQTNYKCWKELDPIVRQHDKDIAILKGESEVA